MTAARNSTSYWFGMQLRPSQSKPHGQEPQLFPQLSQSHCPMGGWQQAVPPLPPQVPFGHGCPVGFRSHWVVDVSVTAVARHDSPEQRFSVQFRAFVAELAQGGLYEHEGHAGQTNWAPQSTPSRLHSDWSS